jgi:hypothetical protein
MPVFAEYSNRFGEPFMSDSPRGIRQARGTPDDPVLAALSRADATPQSDGMLKKTTICPETGRKMYEFTSLTGRKSWMDSYKCPLQEQVMLNKKELPKDQFAAVERQWREKRAKLEQTARDIAAGVDVRFDIETGERVS